MPNEPVSAERGAELLRGILGEFTAPYLTEVRGRLVDGEPVIARPYESVRLAGDWCSGRVLLVGDAAHATTPNLSSGGGMALEDGVVLAQELTKAGVVPAGLEAFMARRRDRVRLVVDTSLRLMELENSGASQRESAPLRMAAMAELARPY